MVGDGRQATGDREWGFDKVRFTGAKKATFAIKIAEYRCMQN